MTEIPAASLPTLVGEDKAGSVAFPVDACYNNVPPPSSRFKNL